MLDTVDFRAHPKLPEFGGYGQLHVRWGKAKRVAARSGGRC